MKIAVLSSHTPSLFWFRLDMMKDFHMSGQEVIAIGPDPQMEWSEKFRHFGIEYHQVNIQRNGISPFEDLKTFMNLYLLMRNEKPDIIFAYHAKTVIYGSIAARLNGITRVHLLIAGLGSIFRGQGLKNQIIRWIMSQEYKIACKYSESVLFQNNDDKNLFEKMGIVQEGKASIINGSGVNLEVFKPVSHPDEPVFLFIGRLIKDKGVMEYLKACELIKTKYPDVRCLLAGPFDSNPSALVPADLKHYIECGYIEYFGELTDVKPVIAQCNVFVLPSYHEGTPKTVLEAMAMGRAIITSRAPGCRETVQDGINGYLVNVKDVDGLVDRMEQFIMNPDLARKMGEISIEVVRAKYDVKHVNRRIMSLMGLKPEENEDGAV